MQITSLNQLKKEAIDNNEPEILQEFYIVLAGGLARSDKRIHFDGKEFTVHHEMDDIFEELSESEMLKSTIYKALVAGALYKVI